MKVVVPQKPIDALVKLLRAKAIDQAKRSEGNDNNKGWYQAGQAEGLGWAADHLEQLIADHGYETEGRFR